MRVAVEAQAPGTTNMDTEAKGESVSERKFGLGDVLIAVAGVAIYLVFLRGFIPYFRIFLSSVYFDRISGFTAWWKLVSTQSEAALAPLFIATNGLVVFNLVGSLVFVVMRLRKPRPPLGRVLLQPGMVAVGAVLAGFVLGVVLLVLDVSGVYAMLVLSLAVSIAWTTLGLIGRWRPEPTWIDRFGRVLGLCWCLLIPVYLALIVLI